MFGLIRASGEHTGHGVRGPWEGMLDQAISQGLGNAASPRATGDGPSRATGPPPTPQGLDNLFLSPPPKVSLVPAGVQHSQDKEATRCSARPSATGVLAPADEEQADASGAKGEDHLIHAAGAG